jgi:hypothetical protein
VVGRPGIFHHSHRTFIRIKLLDTTRSPCQARGAAAAHAVRFIHRLQRNCGVLAYTIRKSRLPLQKRLHSPVKINDDGEFAYQQAARANGAAPDVCHKISKNRVGQSELPGIYGGGESR